MLNGFIIFFHVILSALLITLVLMHSGKDSGLGSIGGGATGAASGGQHVMERNLDRVTIVVALLYVFTTLFLQKMYQ